MNKLKLSILLIIIAFSIEAQDIPIIGEMGGSVGITYDTSGKEIVPVLKGTRYTYKDLGNDVLVIFKENKHIEYFNNKKYSIESSIVWTADNECYMTLQKSNLPNSPFKRGDVFYLKITKIKHGYVYYQSIANGKSWRGRMKRLEI
jgi:hypothetical protein